jgi:CYTH domain-containing protein
MVEIETERRWLLKRMPFRGDLTSYITQHYVLEGDIWVRYRKQVKSGDTLYFKTIKTPTDVDGALLEDENEITSEEYYAIQEGETKKINKFRHYYSHEGLTWEIDEFCNVHLIIVEVELDDINQDINIPQEIQDVIICEVTGDKSFSNGSLAI